MKVFLIWSIKVNSNKSAKSTFANALIPYYTASFTLGEAELIIAISSHYIYLGKPLDEHLTFQMAVHTQHSVPFMP